MARELKDKPLTRINNGEIISSDYGYIEKKDNTKLYNTLMIVLFIIIVLLGLFSTKTDGFPIYYFGFLFFIAGFLLNTFETIGPVVIFFFSHGITGFVLMSVPNAYSIITNPLFRDGLNNVYIYFAAAIISFIAAIITMLLYRYYCKIGNPDKKYPVISLSLFTICDALLVLFPYIIKYIY